ncbi:MAG: 4'-phosphopantetheinyl transferase superfamily protein [Cyclobacteriaceae bacterium]|nr:4'-phosphopantetheinyl transferase superfamily protein [Cyclobacteriaceae bacterium]
MALLDQEISETRAWGLWKIEETETMLGQRAGTSTIPEEIRHPEKRLEHQAVRVLIHYLLQQWGVGFKGLTKNEHGKPFLKNLNFHISLSHSFPFVTAIIDKEKTVGIDLEHIRPKMINIAPRMLHDLERSDAGSNLAKLCLYWCAKEAMLKIHGKKDLTFSKNLLIEPFNVQDTGQLIGRIIVGDKETRLTLHYQLTDTFAFVYNL